MSHLEQRTQGPRRYWYLATTARSGGRVKKIKVFLGTKLTPAKRAAAERLLQAKVAALRSADPLQGLLSAEDLHSVSEQKARYARFLKKGGWPHYYEEFAITFTYNTNAIEGSTLTLLDTRQILEQGRVPEGKSIREIREVENHKAALDYLVAYRGGLTKALALKLHKLLMHNILWRFAGRFRDVQVRVGDFYPPPPESVPEEFSRLMRWYMSNRSRYHPLVVAAYFHAHFERVHPFRDGNGRTGRLLLNHILRSNGYPMLNIPMAERKRYYLALQAVDTGNLALLVQLLRDRLLAERF